MGWFFRGCCQRFDIRPCLRLEGTASEERGMRSCCRLNLALLCSDGQQLPRIQGRVWVSHTVSSGLIPEGLRRLNRVFPQMDCGEGVSYDIANIAVSSSLGSCSDLLGGQPLCFSILKVSVFQAQDGWVHSFYLLHLF